MKPVSAGTAAAPAPGSATVAVLHTLMYFDVFRHPLTTDELHRNCQWHTCSLTETAAALEELQRLGIAGEKDGFWFLGDNRSHVALRMERQHRALHFHKKARRYSSLIASFPFVRAVCVSGSLSKGTMDKDGDIDYFIVTDPGRLWIARTFLVLFKKTVLLNSRKYFCVNYFIDTGNLAIPDRNLFVATEIAFLMPMVNGDVYSEFVRSNHWVSLFYPNRELLSGAETGDYRRGFFKRVTECVLGGKAGEWLDEKFLRLTLHRWKKKFAHMSESTFEVDFRSRKNVSKHHPQGFQRKVSAEMEKRRKEIFESTGISVPALRWEWTAEKEVIRKA